MDIVTVDLSKITGIGVVTESEADSNCIDRVEYLNKRDIIDLATCSSRKRGYTALHGLQKLFPKGLIYEKSLLGYGRLNISCINASSWEERYIQYTGGWSYVFVDVPDKYADYLRSII